MKKLHLLAICLCFILSTMPVAQAQQAGETAPAVGIVPLSTENGPDFIDAQFSTADITVRLLHNGQPYDKETTVTWTIVSADNSANVAIPASHHKMATGLNWGDAPPRAPREVLSSSTSSPNAFLTGTSRVQLTDIMGERTVLVRASVTIEGIPHTVELPVTFGKGPLSQFRVIPFDQYLWAEHQPVSNGANAEAGSFPVAMACGSSLTPAELRTLPDGYHAATNLPSKEQLGMVMGEFGNGGWVAAGWPNTLWSGELHNGGETALSVGSFGFSLYAPVDQRAFPVVCLR